MVRTPPAYQAERVEVTPRSSLQVNRSAQLVLCPQPNLHLLTPHFPWDLGACLALIAFCSVKVIPSLKVDVTLQH